LHVILAKMQGKKLTAKQVTSEIRWDDVELFLALFRLGSLQAGGHQLGIDASTASRRLAAMEKSLQVMLFSRSREGLLPTSYGEQLLPFAEAMELAANRFARGTEQFERLPQGNVRISCPPGLADAFVLPVLPALRKQYPAIQIEIDAQVGVADLARREADIALRAVRPRGDELIMKRVVATRSVVAGSVAYVRSLGRVKRWSDTCFVGLSGGLAHLPHAQWITKHAASAQVPLIANTFPTQIAAACRGLGLVVLPKPYLDSYKLAAVEVSANLAGSFDTLPVDELWMVVHTAMRQLPRVAAVWTFLDEMFASYQE
jgi:DNA-binding transcriptional LysR family regulator